ncbi:MAG: hypothetical protein JNK64_19720 [Myxococcales bacterium]|nr:hypothetical protein [Myxococcales bacterium]
MRSLPIAARWRGQIHLDVDDDATPVAVRDEATYDALIARLPTHRIQQRQPAPLSSDPLRARPPIDFGRAMLIVITRGDTMDPPTLAAVIDAGDHVLVRYAATPPPPAARCYGIGGYAAAQVPRVDGPLVARPARTIVDAADVPAAVGDLVTLRGPLHATRRPTLLGVDVDDGGAAAGLVEATGWLEREDVRQDELDAQLAAHGQFAHRGAGTFYRLVAVEGGQLARPRAAY